MANVTYEIVWIRGLLKDLEIDQKHSAMLYYDNKVAPHIVSNSVFHERTKHIELDCHFA